MERLNGLVFIPPALKFQKLRPGVRIDTGPCRWSWSPVSAAVVAVPRALYAGQYGDGLSGSDAASSAREMPFQLSPVKKSRLCISANPSLTVSTLRDTPRGAVSVGAFFF